MKEKWKPLTDWPDYKISNLGRIYSSKRDRLLKSNLDRGGHLVVGLGHYTYRKTLKVNWLVASEFVDGYFDGARIKHVDGVKTNVSASNLEWVTHGELMRFLSRPVIIVETEEVFDSVKICAEYLGTTPNPIYRCLSTRLSTHKGYHFRYADEIRLDN